jgi:hypothetical protein
VERPEEDCEADQEECCHARTKRPSLPTNAAWLVEVVALFLHLAFGTRLPREQRRGKSAFLFLLLTVDGGFDASGGARIFPCHFAKGGAGGLPFFQRRQRLSEPQQSVRSFG